MREPIMSGELCAPVTSSVTSNVAPGEEGPEALAEVQRPWPLGSDLHISSTGLRITQPVNQ